MSFNEFVNRVKYTLIYFICRNKESPIPLIKTLISRCLQCLFFYFVNFVYLRPPYTRNVYFSSWQDDFVSECCT